MAYQLGGVHVSYIEYHLWPLRVICWWYTCITHVSIYVYNMVYQLGGVHVYYIVSRLWPLWVICWWYPSITHLSIHV